MTKKNIFWWNKQILISKVMISDILIKLLNIKMIKRKWNVKKILWKKKRSKRKNKKEDKNWFNVGMLIKLRERSFKKLRKIIE